MKSLRLRPTAMALLAPVALMAAVVLAPHAAFAAEPSIKDVYAAAQSGQVDKALDMMGLVLKAHPQSGKAHYVEAELLAKQRRYAEARTELATAEQLTPGLGFAKPAAVAALRQQLNGSGPVTSRPVEAPVPAAAERSGGFSWFWAIVIGAGIFGVLALLRRRSATTVYPPAGGGAGPVPYNPGGPGYGGPGAGGYGGPGYGAPQGGGLGSGIMGGLATGAAAGVGFAAGERLIDGMFGNHEQPHGGTSQPSQPQWDPSQSNQDMGGGDFGLSDDSSWDSGGGGGGGDDNW
jgi:hypothetical protein